MAGRSWLLSIWHRLSFLVQLLSDLQCIGIDQVLIDPVWGLPNLTFPGSCRLKASRSRGNIVYIRGNSLRRRHRARVAYFSLFWGEIVELTGSKVSGMEWNA